VPPSRGPVPLAGDSGRIRPVVPGGRPSHPPQGKNPLSPVEREEPHIVHAECRLGPVGYERGSTVRVLEGSRRRSAKLVRGKRKPGCSPLPTKAARFCARSEESIGSGSFTGAPWRVDIEHG